MDFLILESEKHLISRHKFKSSICFLFQDVLGSRTLGDRVLVLLSNMDTYFQFASREPTSAWESQLSHFEAFFRKLPSVLPENVSLHYMKRIMTALENVGLTQKPTEQDFILPKKKCPQKGKAEAVAFFCPGFLSFAENFSSKSNRCIDLCCRSRLQLYHVLLLANWSGSNQLGFLLSVKFYLQSLNIMTLEIYFAKCHNWGKDDAMFIWCNSLVVGWAKFHFHFLFSFTVRSNAYISHYVCHTKCCEFFLQGKRNRKRKCSHKMSVKFGVFTARNEQINGCARSL